MKKTVIVLLIILCSMGTGVVGAKAMVFDEAETTVSVRAVEKTAPVKKQPGKKQPEKKQPAKKGGSKAIILPQTGDNASYLSIIGLGLIISVLYRAKKSNKREGI